MSRGSPVRPAQEDTVIHGSEVTKEYERTPRVLLVDRVCTVLLEAESGHLRGEDPMKGRLL